MSEIRVNKIQGTSGTDTAITLSGANSTVNGTLNVDGAVTLDTTLSVTGVHTIGNNAVVTSEGGATTTNIVQGLAKTFAVVTNSGGTSTLQDSFNLTSATDNGTGDYTLTIANDMGNTNYATPMSGGNTSGSTRYGAISDSDGKTTGAAGFFGFQTSSGGALDQEELSVVFLGDLS